MPDWMRTARGSSLRPSRTVGRSFYLLPVRCPRGVPDSRRRLCPCSVYCSRGAGDYALSSRPRRLIPVGHVLSVQQRTLPLRGIARDPGSRTRGAEKATHSGGLFCNRMWQPRRIAAPRGLSRCLPRHAEASNIRRVWIPPAWFPAPGTATNATCTAAAIPPSPIDA